MITEHHWIQRPEDVPIIDKETTAFKGFEAFCLEYLQLE